jgi:RNA polymerase sigma-70 factor (ECF subfamily)
MAEDLAHDVMVKALEHRSSFEEGTNLRAWLRRILINRFLNLRTKDAVHGRILKDLSDGEVGRFTAGPRPRADDALGAARERRAVRLAVEALPEPYAKALSEVDLGGSRYAEAAASMDVPIGTVMSRLHRGRRMLASRLRAA